MDVRTIDAGQARDLAPGVRATAVVADGELAAATRGGHLELVSEFEVAPGGHVNPHHHPTHEFYLVTAGRGRMSVAGEEREIAPGDLVTIPSDAVHSLEPLGDEPIRCFCFAVADAGAPPIDYGADGDAGAAAGPAPVAAEPAPVAPLDVRGAGAIEPSVEHRGTVAVWWIVAPRELRAATLGGALASVEALTLTGAAHELPAVAAQRVHAVLRGEGSVTAGAERRPLHAGDVVLAAPGVAHRIEPGGDAPLELLTVTYEVPQ